MIKILFICHGNICRSTMAQYVLQDMVNKQQIAEQFYIDSAATSTEEIGNGVHYGTKKKLKEMHIPCGDHRARQITKTDAEKFDYLIGMDDANITNIMKRVGSQYSYKIHKLLSYCGSEESIADPWYTGNFDETYEDVVRGCVALLEYLQQQ